LFCTNQVSPPFTVQGHNFVIQNVRYNRYGQIFENL
jgi:hypothetical protein